MLTVLVLLGGNSAFFDSQQYVFPKSLIEIKGKSMIQHVIENLDRINLEKKFVFAIKETECQKYHLDQVLCLLTDNQCEIVSLARETKGAACSALMAIDWIDHDEPLLISNGDQVLDAELGRIFQQFLNEGKDVAVVCFESVHPRWSFAKLDEAGNVIEAAEKRPISKNAIAGLYFFRHGADFVRAAMKSIKKDANVDGLYYIAPALNELILENKLISMYKVRNEDYHSFYSPQKIKEFEAVKC